MILSWFTVISSQRTSWSSHTLAVRSKWLTLAAAASSMTIWVRMSNHVAIVLPRSSLDAAMTTRSTYGLLAVYLLNSSLDMCFSRTIRFKAYFHVWLASLVQSLNTWWKKDALSRTSLLARDLSIKRLATTTKRRAVARKSLKRLPEMTKNSRSTSSLQRRRLWRSVWDARTSISWTSCAGFSRLIPWNDQRRKRHSSILGSLSAPIKLTEGIARFS